MRTSAPLSSLATYAIARPFGASTGRTVPTRALHQRAMVGAVRINKPDRAAKAIAHHISRHTHVRDPAAIR